MTSLRSDWFAWVNTTRKKMARSSKSPVSHRDAMKAASSTWPKEKERILRKKSRAAKKQGSSAKSEICFQTKKKKAKTCFKVKVGKKT